MRFSGEDLFDLAEAVNVIKGMLDDWGVIAHRVEAELGSGQRVVITYNEKVQEHVVSEVEQ